MTPTTRALLRRETTFSAEAELPFAFDNIDISRAARRASGCTAAQSGMDAFTSYALLCDAVSLSYELDYDPVLRHEELDFIRFNFGAVVAELVEQRVTKLQAYDAALTEQKQRSKELGEPYLNPTFFSSFYDEDLVKDFEETFSAASSGVGRKASGTARRRSEKRPLLLSSLPPPRRPLKP